MPTATGEREPDVTEIRKLEERLDNFRIQVADDLTIRGSAWQGYAFNAPICDGGSSGVGVIACCFEDGSCQLLPPEQCVSSGGTITGGSCEPNPCGETPTGACCIDGVCSILSADDCASGGGNYLGDDTTCEGVDCTTGICCLGTDCETFVTIEECAEAGGIFHGGTEVCDPNPCVNGACCEGGGCSITTAEECGGLFLGEGTTCAGVDCEHTGACCDHGTCTTSTEEDCAGVYQGDGSICDPNPCSQPCCDGGSFYNEEDAKYYQTRKFHVTADFSNGDTSETAHYATIKTENCDGSCTPEGTGTYSRTSDDCNCTEAFICGGPAAGFWGLSGMTFTDDCTPPDCRSALAQLCDFGDCTSTFFFTYENPCPDPESPFSPFSDPFFQNN